MKKTRRTGKGKTAITVAFITLFSAGCTLWESDSSSDEGEENEEYLVQSVASGLYSTFAIETDGNLLAWGFNEDGQIGDGTTQTRLLPIQTGSGSDWTQISTGQRHNLAIKTTGTLWTWGNGTFGQLGHGDATSQYQPVQVGNDSNWKQVSSGDFYSLAIRTDGTLWAWGQHNQGQLGLGTQTDDISIPTQVGSGSGLIWKMVDAGNSHNLAIDKDGKLYSWGYNLSGELGLGYSSSTGETTPKKIGNSNWKYASAGSSHSLAIRDDGTLWGWGNNSYGQIGDGSKNNRNYPVPIGSDTDWEFISAGLYYSLALKNDGTLWSWGRNGTGQLGDNTDSNKTEPAQIGNSSNWKLIAASSDHSLAVKQDGTLWAWGRNNYGQLGNGNTANLYVPTQVTP